MMKKLVLKRIILALSFVLIFSIPGCQKIKNIFIKPAAEGITQESYTVRFSGYEQTVTVRTSPEELLYFLKDTRNWFNVSGAEARMPVSGEDAVAEQMIVGSSFPFNVKKMGIEIQGRIILIKLTTDQLWVIWDNPRMMQVQRWNFEPAKEGTLLTINIATEAPETVLTQIIEDMGIMEIVCSEIDYMLANVQAHFDPSLNPDELVEKGLRGEIYETLWQAHETSVWINASPEDMIQRGLDPENFREILEAGKVEGLAECLYEPENRSRWEGRGSDDPIFCPIKINMAGFEWKGDSFSIMNPGVPQEFSTTYIVAAGTVSRLQLAGLPEKGGTRVSMTLIVEPPGSATSNFVDAILSISGLPRWMKKTLMELKAIAENEKIG